MNKKDIPFFKLYSCVSPEDFVWLFKGEIPQTVAFILSFCPRKNFFRKVMNLLIEEEKKDSNLNVTCTIREYFSRCGNSSYDNALINIVEEQISIMIDGFKKYSDSNKFRKGLFRGVTPMRGAR
jgi:hypothetical protein